MHEFEELLEIDSVGGTTDVLVTANAIDGIHIAVTDADGNVVTFAMTEAEARKLQNTLLTAANSYRHFGGAA